MKNLSVTTFVHLLFSFTIFLLLSAFTLFFLWDNNRMKIEEFKHYQLISLTFLSNLKLNPKKEELYELYKKLHLKEIEEEKAKKLKKEIEKNGETIFSGGLSLGEVRIFEVLNKRYIYVQRMGHNIMLEDKREKDIYLRIAISLSLFLIFMLLILYFAVLKKLSPLKTLNKEIQKFAKGDMKTRISYKYDDKIGKIAKSFDEAILHIKALSNSKNLFMRNIMHELKTPITKGRIIVEMLEDDNSKKVLIRAFDRMNKLINELAEVERLTFQSFEPQFEETTLKDILEYSQKLLLLEKVNIKISINDKKLFTDKELFALALKNLLDNGIKYSPNRCVEVKTTTNYLEVISSGEALKKPLTFYTEPFTQIDKRNEGFGLGLYIVSNILLKLNRDLNYKYLYGKNIFMISINNKCKISKPFLVTDLK